MRIVYLLRKTVPSRETITFQAITMAAEMARAGASVELVVRERTTPDADALMGTYGLVRPEGLTVRVLRSAWIPRFNRWRGRRFARALDRLLGESAPGETIAYTRGERGLELAASLLERQPCPVVYEAHKIYREFHEEKHADPEERARKVARAEALERVVYGGADGLVAISRPLAAAIRARHREGPATVVAENGSSENPEADRVERTEDVVYAGDVAAWKGVSVLVEAMSRLTDRRLRVVGGRWSKDVAALRRDVERRGLAGRIAVTGRRPPAEIPPLLARTRAVAVPLPSSNAQAARFTSPLKLFQALEAGCAVVASDLPSIREIVEDGRDALLVPPGDPDALAAGLERVLADGALRDRLGAAGRETACRYRWPVRARKVLDFLGRVAHRA